MKIMLLPEKLKLPFCGSRSIQINLSEKLQLSTNMPATRKSKKKKYIRPNKPKKERHMNILFKFEIVLTGDPETLTGRVQYDRKPSRRNACKFKLPRPHGNQELSEALETWKLEYRHKLFNLEELDVDTICW